MPTKIKDDRQIHGPLLWPTGGSKDDDVIKGRKTGFGVIDTP